MFFIRAAFWLSLVILLIPAEDTSGKPGEADNVSAVQALGAAQTAISDVGSMCSRNPDVCDTGGAFLQTFGNKARKGAEILYHYLDKTFGEAPRPEREQDGGGTLTGADLQPNWRGPRAGDRV